MSDAWYPEDDIDAQPTGRRRDCRLENPRELTGREKSQHHARYRRHAPKLRTASGAHCRRNKHYAF